MRGIRITQSVGAVAAGVVCLAILGGMIVGHAWPLWTGRTVLLRVRPVDPRDLFRGEFVRLDLPATDLIVTPADAAPVPDGVPVRALGNWPQYAKRGAVVYVQLEPVSGTLEHQAVSISAAPVEDAVNLRGRVRRSGNESVSVDYGLDAFYMQEGTARPVEDAIRENRVVHMEVAVAASGGARIRNLLVDGTPVVR
jgi:uncharacterized membrane-anchored protein